ncbi:hypothetical protein MUK42_36864 [Musa troglodytarum]|uniref:Uncharacterized protein n=1 Tax=Musa troglodytarum TaxID=320322 RepID=A0A9E7G5L1_9LILI|nr:hypothetical protein MUK42_36864 [Musa troglodytarum]
MVFHVIRVFDESSGGDNLRVMSSYLMATRLSKSVHLHAKKYIWGATSALIDHRPAACMDPLDQASTG